MRIDKLKLYILGIAFLATLLYGLLIYNFNFRILALVFVAFGIITFAFIRRNKVTSIYSKQVTLLLFMVSLTYLAMIYGMGIYFGFYKSVVTLSFNALKIYILPLTAVIVIGEYLRYKFAAQNSKLGTLLITLTLIVGDLLFYAYGYNLITFDGVVTLIAVNLIPAIARNLVCNYLTKQYGMIPNIIYKYITVMYMYFIPITPDVHPFLLVLISLFLPYIIYLMVEFGFKKKRESVSFQTHRRVIIGHGIFIIVAASIAMIVSNLFPYRMIVVGSPSMTGSVNKGDAVLYTAYQNSDTIEVGDIIIFTTKDTTLIHRVIEIEKVNGEFHYITKGDANQKPDDGYILNSQIEGSYKGRVPYVGYLTLWARDIFNKK